MAHIPSRINVKAACTGFPGCLPYMLPPPQVAILNSIRPYSETTLFLDILASFLLLVSARIHTLAQILLPSFIGVTQTLGAKLPHFKKSP